MELSTANGVHITKKGTKVGHLICIRNMQMSFFFRENQPVNQTRVLPDCLRHRLISTLPMRSNETKRQRCPLQKADISLVTVQSMRKKFNETKLNLIEFFKRNVN
jgi:hypothetical protein